MTEIFVESNLVMTRKSPPNEVKLVLINFIGYLKLGSICAELPIPSSTSAQLNSQQLCQKESQSSVRFAVEKNLYLMFGMDIELWNKKP